MGVDEIQSKNIGRWTRVCEQKNNVEVKLLEGNLSKEKERKLKGEKDSLQKTLEKIQNAIYL